jgi:hypothetical protein
MVNRILFAMVLVGLAACSGDGDKDVTEPDLVTVADVAPAAEVGPVDVGWQQDKPGLPGPSSYVLILDVEMGPGVTCLEDVQVVCFESATCCHYVFERDLTGLGTKFAFGSTHIAPAIALAMNDTMPMPTFTVLTFNFGIIIGTSDKPPATSSSGVYPFSGFEPEITVTIHNKKYSSKVEGSEGTFDITDWTAEEGGTWAGSLNGTIIQETEKADKLRAQVEGQFEFILPAPAGGQPGG